MDIYGHKVSQLARYFSKSFNEKLSEYGLYSSQWAVALYLYKHKSCTQAELGNYLCVEAPTITRTVARMEKMGWIERRRGSDKREKVISLTEEALNMYEKWESASDELESKATDGIDAGELEVFDRVLKKMTENLSKE